MDELIGFVAAGLTLAGSPGPATLSLAAIGAAFGARRGLAYVAGIVCGMAAVIAATAGGIEGIVAAVPEATPALTVLAALYIAYLAWRIATAPPLSGPDPARRPPRFIAGVLLSLVNPKGYAAMAALFSGFEVVDGSADLDLAFKFAAVMVVMIAVDAAWLVIGARLTRSFRDPVANRAINVVFALLLVASIALALVLLAGSMGAWEVGIGQGLLRG